MEIPTLDCNSAEELEELCYELLGDLREEGPYLLAVAFELRSTLDALLKKRKTA